MDFQNEINRILENRKSNLPKIEHEKERISCLQSRCGEVADLLETLKTNPQIPANLNLDQTIDIIRKRRDDLDNQRNQLDHLRKRFERKSVNIGVSGQARVGKSTLLQTISGLSDAQIPTGEGLPVTAVHSRIYNQAEIEEPFARIRFHTEDSFFTKYIRSHLDQLKGLLWVIEIASFSHFRDFSFPDSIDDKKVQNPTEAGECLKKLKAAQESLANYSPLLRGETKIIKNLGELRPYVAYPTNEQMKSKDSVALKRFYLAVEDIEIFHPFPSLPGNGIGLVDLPGLGEIGESIAKMHLEGLENEVDHVVMVLRPTDTASFVGKSLVNNIDNLYTIQRAISNRGHFISVLINKDKFAEEKGLVRILQDAINREINDNTPDSKFKIYTANAKEANDVNRTLENILKGLTANLPGMDADVLDAVFNKQKTIEADISGILSKMSVAFKELIREYPSDMAQISDGAKRLRGKLAKDLLDMKEKQRNNINPVTDTGDKQKYFSKIDEIYKNNEESIAKNLWKENTWDDEALEAVAGNKASAGFFEDECNRLRVELASSYERMNTYYEERINTFWDEIAALYRTQTGRFIPDSSSGKNAIDYIVQRLNSARSKMEHLEHAFTWLSGIRFDFRQNVFPGIREALQSIESEVPDRSPRNLLDTDILPADSRARISALKKQLQSHADEANYNISCRLKECDKLVEEFIFAALEYFDDMAVRAEDWHTEYMDFCSELRDEIWPGKYTDSKRC
jgi:hypothetical protein